MWEMVEKCGIIYSGFMVQDEVDGCILLGVIRYRKDQSAQEPVGQDLRWCSSMSIYFKETYANFF